MIKELFEPHISSLIAGLITGFIGWFFGRKKANVEVDGDQIENAKKLLEYFQDLADVQGQRIMNLSNDLVTAIDSLKSSEIEKQEVIKKFSEATEQIHELEKKVETLTKELQKYKQLNGKIE